MTFEELKKILEGLKPDMALTVAGGRALLDVIDTLIARIEILEPPGTTPAQARPARRFVGYLVLDPTVGRPCFWSYRPHFSPERSVEVFEFTVEIPPLDRGVTGTIRVEGAPALGPETEKEGINR